MEIVHQLQQLHSQLSTGEGNGKFCQNGNVHLGLNK